MRAGPPLSSRTVAPTFFAGPARVELRSPDLPISHPPNQRLLFGQDWRAGRDVGSGWKRGFVSGSLFYESFPGGYRPFSGDDERFLVATNDLLAVTNNLLALINDFFVMMSFSPL